MLEMLTVPTGTYKAPVKPGQIQWVIPGTYQWTCPEGVESISCILIGAGGNSGNYMGGYGGGVRWKNQIPVVPGQQYTIVVGGLGQDPNINRGARTANQNLAASKSSAFGIEVGYYNVGSPFEDGVDGGYGGGNGSWLNTVTQVRTYTGGWAGQYTNRTIPSRVGANDGMGIKGAQLDKDGFSTTRNYGAGADGFTIGANAYSYDGTPGAVRIIWGAGRAYPATGLANK